MSSKTIRHCRAIICVATILLALGCRPSAPSTHGTVRVNGKAVNGSINFSPLAGTSGGTAGANVWDGSYDVVGLNTGRYTVTFFGTKKDPEIRVREAFGHSTVAADVPVVPPEHADQATIEFEVLPGKNELNFDISF